MAMAIEQDTRMSDYKLLSCQLFLWKRFKEIVDNVLRNIMINTNKLKYMPWIAYNFEANILPYVLKLSV